MRSTQTCQHRHKDQVIVLPRNIRLSFAKSQKQTRTQRSRTIRSFQCHHSQHRLRVLETPLIINYYQWADAANRYVEIQYLSEESNKSTFTLSLSTHSSWAASTELSASRVIPGAVSSSSGAISSSSKGSSGLWGYKVNYTNNNNNNKDKTQK